MTILEGNVEQVEAGLREVTRALLAGADLDHAFEQWHLPEGLDMGLPLAVTFRHAAAAFRILVLAGVCPPRSVWVDETRSQLSDSLPDAFDADLDQLVLLVAAEAGGAALSNLGELPGDTVLMTAALLVLFSVLVEALVAYGLLFDDVFQVLNLARRPAVSPDVESAAASISALELTRLV